MMAEKEKMMADMKAADQRLDDLVATMTAASGMEKMTATEPVEEARRKLHEHRTTSLPVVNSAGGCCGTVSVHRLEKS